MSVGRHRQCGDSQSNVIIEEFKDGREVSIVVFYLWSIMTIDHDDHDNHEHHDPSHHHQPSSSSSPGGRVQAKIVERGNESGFEAGYKGRAAPSGQVLIRMILMMMVI